MTPRSTAMFGVALLAIAIALLGHRYLWSCTWAARDISRFSLRGHVEVISCSKDLIAVSKAVLALDSATTATAAREAERDHSYRRIEEMSDSVRPIMAPFAGAHGWYTTTFGENSNGGYSLIVLDVGRRLLTVESYPM